MKKRERTWPRWKSISNEGGMNWIKGKTNQMKDQFIQASLAWDFHIPWLVLDEERKSIDQRTQKGWVLSIGFSMLFMEKRYQLDGELKYERRSNHPFDCFSSPSSSVHLVHPSRDNDRKEMDELRWHVDLGHEDREDSVTSGRNLSPCMVTRMLLRKG